MVVIIDNYDSFTYNLVQYISETGADVIVFRNDQVEIEAIRSLKPNHIIISPGPGYPSDSGISMRALEEFKDRTPILGVCLGHQCIGEFFGGRVIKAARPMHGKTSTVHHTGDGIFNAIPSPFNVTRYHSLIVAEPLPESLNAVARTESGELMGLCHRELPIFGVQFHPEAILTQHGKMMISNFLKT